MTKLKMIIRRLPRWVRWLVWYLWVYVMLRVRVELERRDLPLSVVMASVGAFAPSAGMRLAYLDGTYRTVSRGLFEQVVRWDWTERLPWVAELFDCDNFSRHFAERLGIMFGLNSVGIVVDYGGAHAYNLVVFSDGTVTLFEPQTDAYPSPGSALQYAYQDGIVLL